MTRNTVPPESASSSFRFPHLFAKAWVGIGLAMLWHLAGPDTPDAGEIAILKSADLPAYNQAIDGFKSTAPPNTTYTEYDLRGDPALGAKIARKLKASDTTLVLAVGLKAAQAAQAELVTVPIVYMMILNPSKHRLTALNMTGTLLEIPAERQLKILRALLPTLPRLGMLFDEQTSGVLIADAVRQAAAQGFQLQLFPVRSEKEVPQQLRALLATSDALWLTPDSTVLTAESVRFILDTALARHIPVIGFSPELTRLGALLSLSVSYDEIGRETGRLAKRLLEGERKLPMKPLPIERFTITVNQKTANFLGLSFPEDLERVIDEKY